MPTLHSKGTRKHVGSRYLLWAYYEALKHMGASTIILLPPFNLQKQIDGHEGRRFRRNVKFLIIRESRSLGKHRSSPLDTITTPRKSGEETKEMASQWLLFFFSW